jgi:threonine/homoserine/homoserine lactone efflux protein
MSLDTWLLYVAAVFVLTVTPGPSVLMCVTNGVNHGARRTFFSAIGSITAVVGIMACSAVGVGAAMAASDTLFHAIKWAGAAYLVYVGITTFRSTTSSFDVSTEPAAPASRRLLYLKGLLVGASNPKALLFFTAFFPQFIDPTAARLPQFLALGATFVAFELFWLMFYATFAARIAPWLRASGRATWFNRISGATFMGAGVLLATVRRAARDA